MSGRFIVLEGIDGAGTTTQCARLAARLRAGKAPVRTTREPSDGPVGATIRQILAGRVVGAGGRAPGWATMALLFAADRADHIDAEIEPFLSTGGTVISDRYDASSLAYQSVRQRTRRRGDGRVDSQPQQARAAGPTSRSSSTSSAEICPPGGGPPAATPPSSTTKTSFSACSALSTEEPPEAHARRPR